MEKVSNINVGEVPKAQDEKAGQLNQSYTVGTLRKAWQALDVFSSVPATMPNQVVLPEEKQRKLATMNSLYKEILQLHNEILVVPLDLKTLFPPYFTKLHPEISQRLKCSPLPVITLNVPARAELLMQKIKDIETLASRALSYLREDETVTMMDKAIMV